MTLSIIIVNYNVKYFLEQALLSCEKALRDIDSEIIVVDNASVDDSVEMVKLKFTNVKLITSLENLGFAKANNVAITQAKGKYIVLLNPDTIVPEDCFHKCIQFYAKTNGIGGLGVRMIDGSGKLLPESKRGFPSPLVSFFKMTGLYKIFPKSKLFNAYYLGHLDYDHEQEIEVLSGAFIFTSREVIDKVGLLDEAYFMYGEDIDWSYRMLLAGYKNYYLPDPTIVHYKGESTSKGSLNYYNTFYKAMILFASKYYSGGKKWGLSILLNGVIWLKAGISIIKNFIDRSYLFIMDCLFILGGIFVIKRIWSNYFFGTPYYFRQDTFWTNAVGFLLIWILSFYYCGVYEKKYKSKDIIIASILGLSINLMLYALLPEQWRASRMILLLSFFWVLVYSVSMRMLINRIQFKRWSVDTQYKKNIALVGPAQLAVEIESILTRTSQQFEIMKFIPEDKIPEASLAWSDIIRVYNIDQLIVSAKHVSWKKILEIMQLIPSKVEFMILSNQHDSIIGSQSKNTKGDLVTMDWQSKYNNPVKQRQKRLFDFIFALLLIIFSWLIVFIQKNKIQFIKNIFTVLFGNATWVGVNKEQSIRYHVPQSKKYIIPILSEINQNLPEEMLEYHLSFYYLNYTIWTDLEICLRELNQLDRTT